MKQRVRRFKSMTIALKELAPFVRDGNHLQTGKPFKRLADLRSREAIGNWLIAAVLNCEHGDNKYCFTTDPAGGDGIIYNSETEVGLPTEHVLIPKNSTASDDSVEERIVRAVELKQAKGGAQYASGKVLVVFSNIEGKPWSPNKTARMLPAHLDFVEVWVFSLQEVVDGEYVYGVSQLSGQGDAPTWRVRLSKDFDQWDIERLQ